MVGTADREPDNQGKEAGCLLHWPAERGAASGVVAGVALPGRPGHPEIAPASQGAADERDCAGAAATVTVSAFAG